MVNRVDFLIKILNTYLNKKLRLYDLLISLKRFLHNRTNPLSKFLDRYSRYHGRNFNFLQIGASEGLRNDPIREFVIRDNWRGVLVEPIPYVFEILKKNYEYILNPVLIFDHAAIVESNTDNMKFYTIRVEFLD